jgi:hypothetical protein
VVVVVVILLQSCTRGDAARGNEPGGGAAMSRRQGLSVGFYNSTCPGAEEIVQRSVRSAALLDPSAPAALLRLAFHDCQVQVQDRRVLHHRSGCSHRLAYAFSNGWDLGGARPATRPFCWTPCPAGDLRARETRRPTSGSAGSTSSTERSGRWRPTAPTSCRARTSSPWPRGTPWRWPGARPSPSPWAAAMPPAPAPPRPPPCSHPPRPAPTAPSPSSPATT